MRLQSLSLTNFRNYASLELEFPPGITLLQGGNAQGKTNLLEAIYYLATTRSPRAGADRELIRWEAEKEVLPFARLTAQVSRKDGLHRLEITLLQTPSGLQKELRLNGLSRRAFEFVGQMKAIFFLPQEVGLISGPPSLRRRHLDVLLSQLDPRYLRTLSLYNRILTQRNHLLRSLREKGARLQGEGASQLDFWDKALAEKGTYILACRQRAVRELNEAMGPVHLRLTEGRERLSLRYESAIPLGSEEAVDLKGLEQRFLAELWKAREREVNLGMSTLGPHRDDLRFLADDVDLGVYGSRGQQRTAVLSLKLAEVRLVQRVIGEPPVVLMDDLMSELDASRRRYLMEVTAELNQAIITATELQVYTPRFLRQVNLLQVREGHISPLAITAGP